MTISFLLGSHPLALAIQTIEQILFVHIHGNEGKLFWISYHSPLLTYMLFF